MSNSTNPNADADANGAAVGGEISTERHITDLLGHFRGLNDQHPEYMARFDDCDLDCAPRADLVSLLNEAPDDKVRYYILSKYTTRLTIAQLTGRPFQ